MEISIESIIAICGGSSVVISGVVGFFAQRLADRRNEKWRGDTEENLKRLENELTEKSTIFNSLIDVQKSNYGFTQQKRIESIDKCWQTLQHFKLSIPAIVVFIFNFLTEKELHSLFDDDKKQKQSNTLKAIVDSDFEEIYKLSKDFQNLLFSQRPFLGEKLYFIMQTYSVFIGRSMYVAEKGYLNDNLIWRHDSSLMVILTTVLSSSEIDFITKQEMNSYRIASEVLENKIINIITDVFSGKVASDDSLEHIKHFKSQLEAMKSEKDIIA